MDMDKEREPQKPPQIDKFAREKVFLAGQASEGGLKVLPGKSWSFHYPNGGEAKNAAISGLLSGEKKPIDVTEDLKPDVLIYDVSTLEQEGLQSVAGKVRDVSSYVAQYDYPRFAQFVSQMHGTEVTPDTVQAIYDGIAQSRIRKKMIDAYGFTGRKQIEDVLRSEAARTVQHIGSLPRVQKVLEALKMNWLAEDLQLARTEQRDQVIVELSDEEKELYGRLKEHYLNYVRRGDESAYEGLAGGIKENIPKIQKEEERAADESMEKLEQELEEYKDEAVPPVTPGDPAIPPDDSDEYHTPQVSPWESKEQAAARPYFEITPSGSSTKPLIGYYASGRKSYYDIESKTWSKKKQVSSYSKDISSSERQTISGTTGGGLKSIPIPNGYGLAVSSIKFNGSKPEISRDQNGCFYINTSGNCNFEVDFLKEDPIFVGSPVEKDSEEIYRGELSTETEDVIRNASGGSLEKAETLRNYLLSKHYYPGDGDLKMAQALQLKLRRDSTGDNYIQNLDKSEYLECYSANTLYIAMLRKAGISSRLVLGHRVEKAIEGKATIDSTTGHAWSEVWDGSAWRRMDATPKPKQQKQDQDLDQTTPSEEAEDNGINRSFDEAQDKQDRGGQDEQGESHFDQGNRSTDPLQMEEASDQDVSQGESDLSNAQEFSDKVNKEKHSLDQQVQDSLSFKDLQKLEQDTQESDLFDDMKEDLQKKLESKEEQMKEEMKKNLDEMVEDGFLDEERRQELEDQINEKLLEELDSLKQQIEKENVMFSEYQDIKEEVMPLVDNWFEYFVERLPRQEEVELDEDSLTRQGAFNRHSVMKPRNLLFGTVKNPRIIKPSIKPKFLAEAVVDVSGSMAGEKLNRARKLLVFYNELFSRIGDEFGYIRYANTVFSDTVKEIKTYDQEYDSPIRYDWGDGAKSTVKVRLMESLIAGGGTDMLPAIKKAAGELNKETFEYPDYASALYFIGDGGDTSGNAQRIKEFLRINEAEHGFGEHMLSAIMLGDESQRQELAAIFGDEHTTVAPDFDTLIEQSMYKFDEDIEDYLKDKTI
ncbi:MAG: hypothetical protein A2687_04090 [Candidatus Levybacteria bacterium RIFCSPHIGHO2_01_FULL_38_26]|nr:MAG: hypothetical protein A2687_04090 [Candidatus Levybacteria bacterium RIFCSPHIGHO2_01_FULL_38_26]